MQMSLPDVQYFLRPGIIELKLGHPDLELLPDNDLLQATRVVLEREARQALSYGAEQGPGTLIGQLRARLERLEGPAPASAQMMITGGASQAIDMLCGLLTTPGDVALVQAPTYHLALRIFHDHQLELLPVAGDDDGLRIDALEERIKSLERQGRKARLLYLVPTFNNPCSRTLSLERRRALVALAERAELMVLEDDVYHELWYDEPPPASLFSLAPGGPVVRLGSFSKILAPGLRLGWMLAPPDTVKRFTQSGVLDSGGGLGHFTAHVLAAYIELGLLDQKVEILRSKYRERRDVLREALERDLPADCRWLSPEGGFFVWLRLPPGVDSSKFLPLAEKAGVSYVPGARFYAHEGGESHCRLNFTMASRDDLEAAARRLGNALRRYQ
jgi:DNA-binding transcriptional MocR family regulator